MQKNAKIYRNKVYKIYFLKNEIKKILLKSIIHNREVVPILRMYCIYKLNKLTMKANISRQKSFCQILSKHRGVYKAFDLKRHAIKKLNVFGRIPNLKKSNW